MNQFENALLNPEPQPFTCYLQEEDPPEEHDVTRYGAVCGRCYEALDSMHKANINALLGALKHLVRWHDQLSESDILYARKAIRKAEEVIP